MPQFRMIRHIVGDDIIPNDCINKRAKNSVGVFNYFMSKKAFIEMPYGSLFNQKIENLFACERIISLAGRGWDATRVITICALTGEIGAEAISLLLPQKKSNFNIDIKLLQQKLSKMA